VVVVKHRVDEGGLFVFGSATWYRIADPRIEQLFATLHRLFCSPVKAKSR
jgi:ArsR family transcriptional regulator